jgi:hypothetical protein
MVTGKQLLLGLSLATTTLLAACSGGGGSSKNYITDASQDVGGDPTGMTTVITFKKNLPAGLGPANFVADSGQLATGAVVVGDTATVTWNALVTPSHQVRAEGIKNTNETFSAVTTTDPAAPTFTIPTATQVAGLGGDTATVQFAGNRVIEAQAEDVSNWTLTVNGQSMDLTGSVFDLDPGTQVLSITFGSLANLHAGFSLVASGVNSVSDVAVDPTVVVGAATGDAVAPSIVSAAQNLTEDEFGRVIDFTFDEAMDPVFSVSGTSFDAGFPTFATAVEQPSDAVLRVTFTDPVIPGLDTVSLTGLMDAHGNAYVDSVEAVTAGSLVANGFPTNPVLDTVENQGGDTVVATFTQAIDPATAEEFARYQLESPVGNVIDLSGATFSYDFTGKELTVTLAQDLVTGDTFLFGASAGAPQPLDVDGEDFVATYSGVVSGDATVPSVNSITQNRTFDPDGETFEVQFSEDVDAGQAEVTSNYVFSGTANVVSATLLGGLDVVRIVLDDVAVPGDVTVDVSNVVDLAGNAMGTQATIAISSSDVTAPTAGSPVAFAEEGADDDTVTVTFDDMMIAAEVEDPLNWVFESPVGTPLDTTNASVAYDEGSQVAVLTFDGGDDVFFAHDASFDLSFLAMRDIAGNVVDAASLTGTTDGERSFPFVESAWVETLDASSLHVQFSEPCDLADEITGLTSYLIRDAGGFAVGAPTTAVVDSDRMGVTLSLGFGVTAGVHTVDVGGVTDLASNQMFPALLFPISTEDADEPALDPGLSVLTAVTGEDNDTVVAQFDRPVSSHDLLDDSNWTLTDGGTPADLSNAAFGFNGTDTVTITLQTTAAYALQFLSSYTLSVDGMRSAQGVEMTGASAELIVVGGDSTPPTLIAGRARLDAQDPTNSILIELDEAMDTTSAADPLSIEIGGVNPDTVSQIGPRTVRATYTGGVTAGQVVDVTIADLAGNSGLQSQAIQSADSVGPIVTFVAGYAVSGFGNDRIEVTWNEPVDPATGVDLDNYVVTEGGNPVDLTNASISYESSTLKVIITLASGVELDPSSTINVVADNVLNHAGIVISPPANINGSTTGDTTAPDFDAAFVNYREDAGGLVVDVRFDEDVDAAFAGSAGNYTVSSGQTVVSAVRVTDDVYRLTLNAALVGGDTVDTVALPDPAGNVSGAISVTPEQ